MNEKSKLIQFRMRLEVEPDPGSPLFWDLERCFLLVRLLAHDREDAMSKLSDFLHVLEGLWSPVHHPPVIDLLRDPPPVLSTTPQEVRAVEDRMVEEVNLLGFSWGIAGTPTGSGFELPETPPS